MFLSRSCSACWLPLFAHWQMGERFLSPPSLNSFINLVWKSWLGGRFSESSSKRKGRCNFADKNGNWWCTRAFSLFQAKLCCCNLARVSWCRWTSELGRRRRELRFGNQSFCITGLPSVSWGKRFHLGFPAHETGITRAGFPPEEGRGVFKSFYISHVWVVL